MKMMVMISDADDDAEDDDDDDEMVLMIDDAAFTSRIHSKTYYSFDQNHNRFSSGPENMMCGYGYFRKDPRM